MCGREDQCESTGATETEFDLCSFLKTAFVQTIWTLIRVNYKKVRKYRISGFGDGSAVKRYLLLQKT